MTADNEVRVLRRFKELSDKNPSIHIDEIRSNLAQRDHMDSTREVSPLRKAEDAVVLDNSHLTPDEQLQLALGWAREKIQD
jgi:cytidylate kinase